MSKFYDDIMRGLLEGVGIKADDDVIKHLQPEREDIRELVNKLCKVPNAYDGFVFGITTYAKKKTERLNAVMDYINHHTDATTSDIIGFVVEQEDFYEDAISSKK